MKIIDKLYWYPERGFMDCNTYVIGDAIIDPGSSICLSEKIHEMQKDGIDANEINWVINTHLHPDHTGANDEFMEDYGAKMLVYEEVKEYFPNPHHYFGDELKIDGIDLNITLTPGHSPESISIYLPEEKALICGDLIFDRGIGRVDLPGGDFKELKRSIEKVSKLEIEYLLPGHGEVIWGKENIDKNFSFIRMSYFWM
ncbi:MAG: hydroxyacylglutathione hydrolase [Candidatus Methanolliviera sp. GoM_asphalt]|nr:MAG: hydroxyacylglutathione hydrolase [Candidatus Methanolliviera sp. GoM_asphalt]